MCLINSHAIQITMLFNLIVIEIDLQVEINESQNETTCFQ